MAEAAANASSSIGIQCARWCSPNLTDASLIALGRLLDACSFRRRLSSQRMDHQTASGAVAAMAGNAKDARNKTLRMMSSSVSIRAYLWCDAKPATGSMLTSAIARSSVTLCSSIGSMGLSWSEL